MTPPTPTESDKRAAENLKESFSIGRFSHFCDEPADFDSAETDEVAKIISEAMQPEREALLTYGRHFAYCTFPKGCTCGFSKALAAIEKVSG